MVDNILVRLETKSKELGEKLWRIVSSMDGFRLRDPGDAGPFELLILELGRDIDREFQIIQSFSSLGTVKEVFLTAPQEDPKVMARAMKMGIREFFSQPLNEEEIRQALDKFQTTA